MTAVMSWCISSCINEEPLSSPVNNSSGTGISFTLGGSAGAKALTRTGDEPTAYDYETYIDHLHVVAYKGNALTAVVPPAQVGGNATDGYTANVGASGTMDIYFIANADATLAALIEALQVGSSPTTLEGLIATQSAGEYEESPTYTGKFLMMGKAGSITVKASDTSTHYTNIGSVELSRLAARIDIAEMPSGFTISSVQVCNRYTKSLLVREGNSNSMTNLGDPSNMTAVTLTNAALPYQGRFFVYEDPTSQLEVAISGTYGGKPITAVVSFATPAGGGEAIPIKRNSIYTISLAESSDTHAAATLDGSIIVKDWDTGATVTADNSAIIGNNAAPTAVSFSNLSNCTETSGTLNVTTAETAVSFDVVVTNASKGNISKLVCKYPVTGKGITISGGDFTDDTHQTFTVNITSACASDPYILEAQNVLKNTASLSFTVNVNDQGVALASAAVGNIIASNGKAYTTANYSPIFGTKVAVVGKAGASGYAIALVDADSQTWNEITSDGTNKDTDCTLANGKRGSVPAAPAGTAWKILTKAGYSSLFESMGNQTGGTEYVYNADINTLITAAGGTAMSDYYWTTSENSNDYGWDFNNENYLNYAKTENAKVRPVLVW